MIIRKIYGNVPQKNKMILYVLCFCVFHAFCGSSEATEGIDLLEPAVMPAPPNRWDQYVEDLPLLRHIEMPLPHNRHFKLTSNMSLGQEDIEIWASTAADRFSKSLMLCTMPHWTIRDNGDIFSIRVTNDEQRMNIYGYVLYQHEDAQTGTLIVKPPREAAKTVTFITDGARPQIFCQYDAQKDSLCITRFLVQYRDLRGTQPQFFVRIEIPYANVEKITVTWGVRETHAACIEDSLLGEPTIFDFLRGRGFVVSPLS